MAEERAFSWDDEYTEAEEFTTLPEGDYPFKIVNFERAYFEGSDKMPACPEAKITYQVTTPDGATATVQQNLFLHSKFAWQMTNFACAIGHCKRGDGKFKVRWNEVIGATGRFRLSIRKYNDKEYNQVKKFYDKEVTSAPDAGQASGSYTMGAF